MWLDRQPVDVLRGGGEMMMAYVRPPVARGGGILATYRIRVRISSRKAPAPTCAVFSRRHASGQPTVSAVVNLPRTDGTARQLVPPS